RRHTRCYRDWSSDVCSSDLFESFLGLSKTFGDLVQGFLAQRFKGSPDAAQPASVRQLRTTAAPAIAVEISSVTVEDRADLDRMRSEGRRVGKGGRDRGARGE